MNIIGWGITGTLLGCTAVVFASLTAIKQAPYGTGRYLCYYMAGLLGYGAIGAGVLLLLVQVFA